MKRLRILGVLALFLAACGSSGKDDKAGPAKPGKVKDPVPTGPVCKPERSSETECSGGTDDDCDGYIDCLDSECDGQACGDGLTCSGGACRKPCPPGDTSCVPELPTIQNVKVTTRGDTAIIEFEPVPGAKDYRIYPEPKTEDWLIGDDGNVGVKNGIYRCAGDGVAQDREHDEGATGFKCQLSGCDNARHNYVRKEEESRLGYVYLTPAADRKAVYRVANPNGGGGFRNSSWIAPIYQEANSAEYVVGTEARDALLQQGWRDDGIAFYTSDTATKSVYRIHYAPKADWQGDNVVFFFTDGPEHDARAAQPAEEIADLGERFKIMETEAPGSVALHRVTYGSFDVLAAGEARFDKVMHQGVRPVWALAWPGIKADTRFIIEALDAGCPFPNGYLAAVHHDADLDRVSKEPFNSPSLTLDEARLSSGELYVNGQHDPQSRPKPVARAYVDVKPEAQPKFDFLATFDEGAEWEPFTKWQDNNAFVFRNSSWAIDTSGCTDNFTFGPLLGQFAIGFADGGSSCNISMTPKKVPTKLSPDSYLHLRMSTDIPSTGRRYPQIMITDEPLKDDPVEGASYIDDVPVHSRLGNFPFDWKGKDQKLGTADDVAPEGARTIVVQPFGGQQETQIQFCDTRSWGVNSQCDRANVYGNHAGYDKDDKFKLPWTSVPVQNNLVGFDRPVQWDVYASNRRVYVFMDGKPSGCAVLPEGRMPAGDVTVAFRAVLYHCGIDESVTPEDTGHVYEKAYSICHSDRKFDDLGVELSVPEPAWDESVLPCGSKWYGGG